MLKAVGILVFSLAAQNSLAYINQRGNSGDVVQCNKGPYQFLDFYLFEKKLNLEDGFVLSKSNMDISRLTTGDLIETLRSVDPKKADLYSQWLKEFFSEVFFVADMPDRVFFDEGMPALEQTMFNCAIRQTVVQWRLPIQQYRYLISAKIWQALPEMERAMLVFHELVVREYLQASAEPILTTGAQNIVQSTLALYLYQTTDRRMFYWQRLQYFVRELNLYKKQQGLTASQEIAP